MKKNGYAHRVPHPKKPFYFSKNYIKIKLKKLYYNFITIFFKLFIIIDRVAYEIWPLKSRSISYKLIPLLSTSYSNQRKNRSCKTSKM